MKKELFGVAILLLVLGIVTMSGCIESGPAPIAKSDSGVSKTSVSVKPAVNGLTVEQWAITEKIARDNRPDTLKYFYLIAQNGQVVMHDVVKFKLVSSGKRLTPRNVVDTYPLNYIGDSSTNSYNGFPFTMNGRVAVTQETLEDDGTYGDSGQYFYYFTTAGNFVKVIPMGMFIGLESDKQLAPSEIVMMTQSIQS